MYPWRGVNAKIFHPTWTIWQWCPISVFGQGVMMIRPCNSTISTDAFALSLFLRSGRFNDSTRPWSRWWWWCSNRVYLPPALRNTPSRRNYFRIRASTYTECAVYPVPSTTSWVLYHCTVEEQQQQHVQSHCREEEDDEHSCHGVDKGWTGQSFESCWVAHRKWNWMGMDLKSNWSRSRLCTMLATTHKLIPITLHGSNWKRYPVTSGAPSNGGQGAKDEEMVIRPNEPSSLSLSLEGHWTNFQDQRNTTSPGGMHVSK